MAQPPEPTAEEAAKIHAAHDAIRADTSGALGPADSGNWGTATEPMREIWTRAREADLITAEAYALARRDSGLFWDMTVDGF